MIARKQDAKQREFKGVRFDLLAVGARSMVTKMRYVAGAVVPVHTHPNEQAGYVVSGRYTLRVGGREETLAAGDSYAIPADEPHGIEVIQGGEVVDVFTPPREDYR